MIPFVGRVKELGLLHDELKAVRTQGEGRFVWIRGRRRVGKSRLTDAFVDREKVPFVFFQAPRRARADALDRFRVALASSDLPAASQIRSGTNFTSWLAALGLAASGATREQPVVIVIDELPYLVEHDPGFAADLQAAWDRELQHCPVLLICIGSDVRMMRTLTEYPAELHGRPTRELWVPPFSPRELATLSHLSAEQAFDRYLVVGGFPVLARSWTGSQSRRQFLERVLADSASAFVVNGQRIVEAEFAANVPAHDVLLAIGHGETTFTTIRNTSGVGNEATLTTALNLLVAKDLVDVHLPYAAPPGKRDRRYVVSDPYLRFWLRFVAPGIDEIDRGRGAVVVDRIERNWATFRGAAIEPVIRQALERLLPDPRFGDARFVGAYWTRSNDPEVDLVGAGEPEPRHTVAFVGLIKWRENTPFTRRDTESLIEQRAKVPGARNARLVGVSRSGFLASALDVELGAEKLLLAWPDSAG